MRIVFHKWKYLLSLSMLWTTLISEAQQLTHQMTFNVNDIEITQVNGYDMVRLVNGGYIDGEENAGEPHKNKTTPADFLPTKKISYFCTLNFWYEFKRKIIIVFHCF